MKIYEKLSKYSTFSSKDVTDITGNKHTTSSTISRLLAKKYIVRIRKDLYSCIDLTVGDVIANKYQIASAVNDSSYVSNHSAFEFYGLGNQVYNIIYVASEQKFREFYFNGITYKYVKSNFSDGVHNAKYINDVKITDIERTFVDSINNISKISGVEEMIKITESIDYLDTTKLLNYMKKYNKKILYQKVAYFLKNYYYGEKLSDNFFAVCNIKSGNNVGYLEYGVEGKFDSEFNLVVAEKYTRSKELEKLNGYI